MITAGEIYDYLNLIAPFENAMSFDNVGLLIGGREAQSETVLLALDITNEIIREAVSKNCHIIITHHPIIFHALKNISFDHLCYSLIQNQITVISAHTNLDLAKGGVNDTLAEKIGILSENGTDEDCLLIGSILSINSEELAEKIKIHLNLHGLRYTKRKGMIQKVAVSCGAGGNNILKAKAMGAEAFITGEIKHHEILYACENNIAVYDLGHFASEDLIIKKLAEQLSGNFHHAIFEQAQNDKENYQYI